MSSPFKFEFGLEKDPDGGVGSTPEESASWGWVQLWVGNVNLCEHSSHGALYDRVHWYLLPLLEWFVAHWDPLLNESRLPEPFAGAASARDGYWSVNPFDLDEEVGSRVLDWRSRHALRAGATGGVLPDVFIRRFQDDIEFSWGHADALGSPARFQARRDHRSFPAKDVATRLHESVGRAISEIRRKVPQSQRLRDLAESHAALEKPRPLDRAAWMAGIGKSFAESVDRVKGWLERIDGAKGQILAGAKTGLLIEHAPPALLMFGSLSPNITEGDVSTLLGVLRNAAKAPPASLPKIDAAEFRLDNAWDQGYELADRAREAMKIADGPYTDIEQILRKRRIAVREIQLADSKVRAVAIRGPGLAPSIAINTGCANNTRDEGRRFTLAHELCHLLFDATRGVPLAVATGPWAPKEIEKRANAFAAMFLMPRAAS
ncbi:MAG: ImmA/IrrE family metallo-endopeptidase [Bryobacteraceae bacterium]